MFYAFFSFCFCCVCVAYRNDLLGLDGMVKITNPDENVNHLPAVGNYVPDAENCNIENDEHKRLLFYLLFCSDGTVFCVLICCIIIILIKNVRPSAGSNPHRSLPDIPVLASDVNGDTSSELYATVDDKTVSLGIPPRQKYIILPKIVYFQRIKNDTLFLMVWTQVQVYLIKAASVNLIVTTPD